MTDVLCIQSRKFEILALLKTLNNVKSSSSSRAFQTLPRHLRRRAASHNPNRVPLRLRQKALNEIKGDANRLKKKRRKLLRTRFKKQQPNQNRTLNLLKRQLNKSWLETHIWHAKRMKMLNLWGYRLSKHPTEKSFRPSIRSTKHGSIIHDSSYHSILQLNGNQSDLLILLNSIIDLSGDSPSSKRFIFGTRELQTYIYNFNKYPLSLISPVSLIWHPCQGIRDYRSLWIKCHPSALFKILDSLNEAKLKLNLCNISIEDLTSQFNVFEIYGPKSSQIITGALNLSSRANGRAQRIAWHKISKALTPNHLPTNFIASFNVDDPRLHFPPRNIKLNDNDKLKQDINTLTLSTTLSNGDLFDFDKRSKLFKPKFKKFDIDNRRSNIGIPGKPLQPTKDDDIIPITIIQNKIENSSRNLDLSISGYTLLLPKGWGMSFWSSLIHTGCRIGGLDQIEQFNLQNGKSYFPFSGCPTSLTNWESCLNIQDETENKVNKLPKDKRPKFHSNLPFLPYLTLPFDIESKSDQNLIPTQPTSLKSVDERTSNQWLMTSGLISLLQENIDATFNENQLQVKLNELIRSLKSNNDLHSSYNVNIIDALVQIPLTPINRGFPRNFAYIYNKQSHSLIGRVAASTFGMSKGKTLVIGNIKALDYFDMFLNKNYIVSIQDNDNLTQRDFKIHCIS